jgi:type I restriction enzyme S subunit
MEKLEQINHLNLSEVELSIVRKILKEKIPNTVVEAYGSRVDGTNKKFSDLDLIIYLDPLENIDKFAILREAFDESNLPFTVDIQSTSELRGKEFPKIQLQ